ncbi:MAG: methylmalonyl-CoA mutase family protein [Acidimicrobiia bacterium]|nr:methylmalonyl-CoA mutase family protein [Acidimicrobiia bacterium]
MTPSRRPRPEGSAVSTDSGLTVKALYDADDIGDDLGVRLGAPGHPPFTRGPYETMYRDRLWTMRQYAGFGSGDDTNARYRFLLEQGQTALSVAFDLPTQLGLDSHHPLAEAEVGRVGVAIDTVDDMADVFDGLPLDQLSVNFTINATAPIILAFYLVTAERRGIEWDQLSGTVQNDILKEFLARHTFIYPPGPSMRLACDLVEFAATEVPRFNPISVTGYHAREAGADAIQELAFAMSSAIAYCDELVGRGLPFDSFAPRVSFHFATTLDLFEEVAKLRAARRVWHRLATERYGAQVEASARLRFFSGCSGATLTAQQPLNNVVRSTIQCMGAVLGGAQSIHVMGYDEALEIPTEEAVTLALRTQQIVALESGLTRTIDPLAGSFYLESLTDEIERAAGDLIAEIEGHGGAVAALGEGILQRWIAEKAYQTERELSTGHRPKVGVNCYTDDSDVDQLRLFEMDDAVCERQIARTRQRLERRDGREVAVALEGVVAAATTSDNVMPPLIEAARAGATLGEASAALLSVFGEYREPELW